MNEINVINFLSDNDVVFNASEVLEAVISRDFLVQAVVNAPAKYNKTTIKKFSLKPGKFFKKYCSGLSDDNIRILVEKLKYEWENSRNQISVVYTTDFEWGYNRVNYKTLSSGNLCKSCMSYPSVCLGASKFYFDLNEHLEFIGVGSIRLAVEHDSERLVHSRRLIWTIEDREYSDRVYSIYDQYSFANSEYTYQQVSKLPTFLIPTPWRLSDIDSIFWPYLDTFCYLLKDGFGRLYLSNDNYVSGYELVAELLTTDGRINACACDYCGTLVNVHDTTEVNNEIICDNCLSSHYVYSDYYEEYILLEDAGWSEYEYTYFDTSDDSFVYSEIIDDHLLYDNSVFSEYHNDYIPIDQAWDDANGDWFHESDEYIEINGYRYAIEVIKQSYGV